MAGNTIGEAFKLTTYGESHGVAVGGIIDGCPPNINIDLDFIQNELNRRRPGQSKITTPRDESDRIEILSGVFEGKSTGTPIAFEIRNKDQRSKDYNHIKSTYRPSHADYTYDQKYGFRDYRGGGRSSARETIARVAGGAIAKLILKEFNIQITGFVSRVGEVDLDKSYKSLDLTTTDSNIVRCPDKETADKMIALIEEARDDGDSLGGIVSCVIGGTPVGLGEPVFDKLHADLAKAMLSINAVKGFEYGSGFEATKMRGSQHNDVFEISNKKVCTRTNHSGGIQGGISNGEDIYFNVGFKPTATIMKDQTTIDGEGKETVLEGKGRHDPCVLPRAVPIVESMAALTILDHLLRNKKYA